MTIELVSPDELPMPDTHRQVAVASGSRMVFIAGQVSIDADGAVVGLGDVTAQVTQCYLNVATALAAVGASFDDVGKLTVYVVDLDHDRMAAFGAGLEAACEILGIAQPLAPLTGIGVSALAAPEFMVEIEAIAVIGAPAEC